MWYNRCTIMEARHTMHRLLRNPRQLFLIDSLGAGLTLFFLLAILLPFNRQFGMPLHILLILAVPALLFALYSACCFWWTGTRWRPFLRAISVANLLYCCLTAGLVVSHYSQLTGLGVAYFVLEMGVICVLVSVEQRAIRKA